MCGNLEAVQFHPTGIFPAGILVTEGCRGDGVCFATSTAIASCRTLNLKRKNLPLVTSFPVVWKNVLLRARALRAASVTPLARHHAAR